MPIDPKRVFVLRDCGHVRPIADPGDEPCPYCTHNLVYQDELVDDALKRAVVRHTQ